MVDVELVAEMSVLNPFDFFLEPTAEAFPFTYDAALAKELTPFLECLPAGPKLGGVSRQPSTPARSGRGLPRRR